MKKCPACGASVKLENLERHVKNQHPRETVDLSKMITKEERRKVVEEETRRRRTVTPGGFIIVLIVAAIVALILAVAILNPFGLGAGSGAPDFRLDDTTGSEIHLNDLRGRPVFLEFMDVDCHFCESEARDVLRFVYDNYSSSVTFISVDVNFVGSQDNVNRINTFKLTYDTPWRYALDVDGEVTRLYGVSSTPTTFILDSTGKIVEKIVGAAPGGYHTYAAALDEALARG